MRKSQQRPTAAAGISSRPRPVWLLWDCTDLVAVYDTEHGAQEAGADLRHQLLCEYGPDAQMLKSVTVTPAPLHETTAPTVAVAP